MLCTKFLNESILLVILDDHTYICLSQKGPSLISDLRECLKRMELSDEYLIYLDELKRCFEAENLSKVNESQIQKLGKLYFAIGFVLN